MSKWPSTKARRVLAALLRIGCNKKPGHILISDYPKAL